MTWRTFGTARRVSTVVALGVGMIALATGCASSTPLPVFVAAPSPSGLPSSAPSPTPSSAPSPASPSPAASVSVPAGATAGIAVFDRQTATFTEQRQATRQFRSASLVKLLIALDYLWTRGPGYAIPATDRARFDLMLRSSDDNAASSFWNSDGREQIVTRMVGRLGLQNTAPPSAVGKTGWGSTALSAADVVRIYRYVLDSAPAPVREAIMGNLRQSTPCGTDHYDQSFGIPSAFNRPWAVKQGWYGFGDNPTQPCTTNAGAALRIPAAVPASILTGEVLHTTGVVGADDRVIVVVLTQHPPGHPFSEVSATVTRLVRSLRIPGAAQKPGG